MSKSQTGIPEDLRRQLNELEQRRHEEQKDKAREEDLQKEILKQRQREDDQRRVEAFILGTGQYTYAILSASVILGHIGGGDPEPTAETYKALAHYASASAPFFAAQFFSNLVSAPDHVSPLPPELRDVFAKPSEPDIKMSPY